MIHKPVMLEEVIACLDPKPNQNFIDCTFGGGGHAKAMLERIRPEGKLLGIDQNSDIKKFRNKEIEEDGLILINDNFKNLEQIYEHNFPYPVNGILFDLGLSSIELDSSGLGFSFKRDEPLDMRFNPESQRLTAAEVLNKYSKNRLVEIFRECGEVDAKKAKEAAEKIVKMRRKKKFERTIELVEIIGDKGRYDRIHPATLFFQALRIEVNDELNALKQALPQAVEILKPWGKLAVISFHSLEDRLVKYFFKGLAEEEKVKILTKKPIRPSEDEVKINPRARSGKLRAAEKN